MMNFIKKNFVILLAFLLPILLIIIVVLIVYLPSLFISTDYNFVYASCTNGNYNYYSNNCNSYSKSLYKVKENRIVMNDVSGDQDLNRNKVPDVEENSEPHLFLYNSANDESKEITFKEAQKLIISDSLTSPDGVAVEGIWDRGTEFFPFYDYSSDYGYYLTKGKSKKKIHY